MKKTKLLTSVAALALVLSLGACNQPEDDSTGSEETSSETSSSSSSTSTEPETVTLTNYTLSITLKDEAGEPVAIPFYDSVYICGSWDSWAEWTVLTDIGDETESVLTTTFASIEEGTYEFKGVVGGQDDAPSWNLTEFIVSSTGGNVSFEVNAEDGDNYTNNLEFTVDATKVPVLEETPMTEAEIITAILATAEKADDEGLGWAAFKGVETDSTYDEEVNAYLTTDDNDNLYGAVFDYEDDELSFEYYYVDGVEYSHGLTYDNYFTEDDPEDFECGSNLEDALEWYLDGFEPFPYLSYEDREDWVLGHEEGSSIYTLAIPGYYTDTLTLRRAGDDFEIIAVSEVADGEEVSAELITAADVEAQMGGFNKWNWADAQDPAELIENIHESGCYSLEIEYDIYIASEGTTYWDYMIGNYDLDALEETLVLDTSYICDFYITEDAFLFEEYIYYDLGFYAFYSLVYSELIVNDYDSTYGDVMWDFVLDNSYNWALDDLYYGHWQDYFYSLFDEGTEGCFSANSFTYYGSGTYGGVPCTAWDLDSSAASSLFLLLGTDWLFQNPSNATIGKYYMLTYFFEGLQEMLVTYGYYGFTYYEYPTEWTDLVYLQEVYFYADIYDVGTTDIDDEIATAFAGLD